MKVLLTLVGKPVYVDDEDYERCMALKWRYDNGRPCSKAGFLHRFVMGCAKGDGKIVDHKDGNPLNNCKSNLRFCTRAQNCYNRGPAKNARGPYKGVIPFDSGKFGAYFRNMFIGSYATAEEAARAYDTHIVKIHGEFAHLNFTIRRMD